MLSGLSQRARAISVGVVGAVLAFFVFGGASGGGGGGAARRPLDAVPRDAFLVGTLNLAELRRSPLYELLLGNGSSEHGAGTPPLLSAKALGVGKLADACGFDPLSRVEELAVAVPEDGEKGELGVAARGNVTASELSRCTNALAEQRGGKVATKDLGSFTVVDEGRERARIGYGLGLLVVGRGAWFDAMVETADGKRPSARESALHSSIRTSLTGRDGWTSPTLLVSAILPRSIRDRIKHEMGPELESTKDKSPEGSQNVMAGVLGVSAVGLALRAGSAGQSIDAAIELSCDSDDACAAVEKLILRKRLEASKELALRMVGFGRVLDSVEVERKGSRVRVTAGDSASGLASTIDRVLRLRGRGAAHEPREPHKDDTPPPRPAETIPAPRPSR